jgi:predicted nucleic acid-binding protein
LSLAAQGILLVCHNQAILDEYEDVLSRPSFMFGVAPEERRFVLDTLKDGGLLCDIRTASVFPMKDESDRIFYDVAKTAGAFLITGNMKHYPREPFIVTLAEFANTKL